jgi:exodeoxyribonuclease VII large subunit
MPFNDEGLARAVAAGTVPIVTGIGHEPDTTIADMVGDVRASTPTAAAEHVVPDVAQLNASLDAMGGALANALKARMTFMSGRVAALRSRPIFSDASSLTSARELLLEQTAMRLQGSIPNKMRRDREDVAARRARLERVGASMLEKYRASMGIQAAKLQSLSPLAVLARGYSVTYDGAGGVVSGLDAVDCGDRLSVRVQDGYYDCTVDAKRRNP